jgi:hypothetical protein
VGEDPRDYETAEVDQCWSVVADMCLNSGGQKWVLGSSKAVNAACLAVFDPSTNSTLSRQLESAGKKSIWGD